jgi:drug/metabolite transporter (DMT)-like permease
MAGLFGALGLAGLYRALAIGPAASVAPTSAVVGAVLPVAYTMINGMLPGTARLAGFALALVGIWFVARGDVPSQQGAEGAAQSGQHTRAALWLACAAGASFGLFYVMLGQLSPGTVFIPLVAARSMSLVTALVLLGARRGPMPSPAANPLALLAGALDAGGNIFFVLARQSTGLAVASVLSSLYPAATVLLASVLLKEKIRAAQWLGVALCLSAILLITW